MELFELSKLSELSNRELKNILRENQVKNYSKLNKKELVKKVNLLIKQQNGGGKKSRKNKKYTLRDLIGGHTDPPVKGAEIDSRSISRPESKNSNQAVETRNESNNSAVSKQIQAQGAETGKKKNNLEITSPNPINQSKNCDPCSIQ